jgi:CRP-like cAMP-binding protein
MADFPRSIGWAHSLRACQLFSGVPAEELETIARIAVQKQLAKGEYLFRKDAPSRGFYVVQSGRINVHCVAANGREQVIHIFEPGDSFAEASLAGNGGYPADARAIGPSNVLLIPKAAIIDLLRRRPELALQILGSLSQHLRVLVSLLDDLTLKDVEARLANWTLKRCPSPHASSPVTFVLDRTKRVLAAELGTASETISRTLAKWRSQKIVAVEGRTITVLNPAKLNALLARHLGES